jgi:hypothetical protein
LVDLARNDLSIPKTPKPQLFKDIDVVIMFILNEQGCRL